VITAIAHLLSAPPSSSNPTRLMEELAKRPASILSSCCTANWTVVKHNV
jgi:hypothetical protein